MSVNPEKKLGDATVETSPSNKDITGALGITKREIEGTNRSVGDSQIDDVDASKVVGMSQVGIPGTANNLVIGDQISGQLTHKDSALGDFLFRQRKLKKAA